MEFVYLIENIAAYTTEVQSIAPSDIHTPFGRFLATLQVAKEPGVGPSATGASQSRECPRSAEQMANLFIDTNHTPAIHDDIHLVFEHQKSLEGTSWIVQRRNGFRMDDRIPARHSFGVYLPNKTLAILSCSLFRHHAQYDLVRAITTESINQVNRFQKQPASFVNEEVSEEDEGTQPHEHRLIAAGCGSQPGQSFYVRKLAGVFHHWRCIDRAIGFRRVAGVKRKSGPGQHSVGPNQKPLARADVNLQIIQATWVDTLL